MFDSMLESTGARSGDRSIWNFPISLLVHLVVVTVLVALSLMAVQVVREKLDPELIIDTTPSLPPPPPPPPPPGPSIATRAPTVEEMQVEPEPEVTAPDIFPDIIPETSIQNDAGRGTGILGGLPGGASDGVAGGDPRGVLGGVLGNPLVPIVPTPDVTLPVRLVRVDPEFPETARRSRLSGKVVCAAVIDVAGNVTEVTILTSASPYFNEPTIRAVRQWKYRPAMLDGTPVSVYLTVVVDFELR